MRTLAILALAVLAVAVVVPAYCQQTPAAPAKAPVAPETVKIDGVISSVIVAESKIVIDEGAKKFTTVIVEKTTEITLADGKAGRLEELSGKIGDKVAVLATEDGKAVSIKVLPAIPPIPPVPPVK